MEMEGRTLQPKHYNGQEKMIIKREDGFSLVELMITMVVFVLFMVAATNVFTGLLTQFKQQSKQAETNIEGIVGLEILRQDIEGAGYGLPWNGIISYNEVTGNPYSLNDAPTGIPKAIVSENNASFSGSNNIFNGSDYLAIKSVTVARNSASAKWTSLYSTSMKRPPTAPTASYVRTWETAGETAAAPPVSENLQSTDRVIVISPMGADNKTPRELMVNSTAFSTTFSGVTSLPWRPPVSSVQETRLVYGVDPDYTLRMPFNRADYFIQKYQGSNSIVPKRCAPNTGVLMKATVNHNNGGFTYLPLLECVADMQVIFGLDTNLDGSFDPLHDAADTYSEDLTGLTAQNIREQVKQVRVYILAHEGQRDITFTYPSSTVSLGGDVAGGLGRTFNLATAIGDPDYKYYRWKLYTIVVTPNNLE
jgi:prepilin-type N-terminal cleavage/methylation domain-containing protein